MHLTRAEIDEAIKDEEWQALRRGLKGKSTERKLQELGDWIRDETAAEHPKRCIQVQNYLNALSRGGQIAPCDLEQPVAFQVRDAHILR